LGTRRLCFALALSSLSCATAPDARPSPRPPAVTDQSLEIVSQSLTDCALTFTLTVESPEAPAVARRLTYELVVDGTVVKRGEKLLDVSLEPGRSAVVTLDESLTYAANDAELKALSDRGGSLLAAVRGTLQVQAGAQPPNDLSVARSKDIRTPRVPHVKLVEFEAGRIGDGEVQIVFHLGVVNPNPFLLSLSGLDYAITIAGKQLSSGTIGAGEKAAPGSTAMFDLPTSLSEETHGKEALKLIKSRILPFQVKGLLRTAMYSEALDASGDIKLAPSR
jgi:hypothetical protein